MFSIFLLLSLNFTILRSVRNTLAVVDLGGGAQSIPFFELFGGMPGAFLMTGALAWLLNRYSLQKVFMLTLTVFLGFFLVFAFCIYPILLVVKQRGELGAMVVNVFAMLFYVMAELWKPALAIILFWGLVNQYVPLTDAKKLYAPLMLGGSLGSIVAGPAISVCTSEQVWRWFPLSSEKWVHGFNLMILLIVLIGAITGFFYHRLWRYFSQQVPCPQASLTMPSQSISLKDSIGACMQSKPLRLLSWIVIADYIAYSLGEVIFLEVLKFRYPLASDYCNYLGYLSVWCGVLTFISSLLIAPIVLQRFSWVVSALITPICLLVTEGLFFIFLRGQSFSSMLFGWTEMEWVGVVVLLGSIQYCICRGAKYAFFDSSKEIAFVLIPDLKRMKGKLVVDGLCARVGRGSASMFSIVLIKVFGGVIASAFVTGFIALGLAMSWVISTFKLGKSLEEANGQKTKDEKDLNDLKDLNRA